MKRRTSVILVACAIISVLLFVVGIAFFVFFGPPDAWSKHHYEPVKLLSDFENFRNRNSIDKYFQKGYSFTIKVVGEDEGNHSGGSPFMIAIVANTYLGPDMRWQIESVDVTSSTKKSYSVIVDNGEYIKPFSVSSEFVVDGLKLYYMSSWTSAFEIELDHDVDKNLNVVVVIRVVDENGSLNQILIERDFISVKQQGWFKIQM